MIMKKLTIADVKATEILSKEERKMVLGGIQLGSTGNSCFNDSSCSSNERCISGYCINYSYGEAGGSCYAVIYEDYRYYREYNRIAFFDNLQEADNYAFNMSGYSEVKNVGVYNCS